MKIFQIMSHIDIEIRMFGQKINYRLHYFVILLYYAVIFSTLMTFIGIYEILLYYKYKVAEFKLVHLFSYPYITLAFNAVISQFNFMLLTLLIRFRHVNKIFR